MATALTAPAGVAAGAPDRQRRRVDGLLVVANETLTGETLVRAVNELVWPSAAVLVVCPVLVSRVRYWTSDLTGGLLAAQARLRPSLTTLTGLGLHANGMVGDADPVLAIEDALHLFPAEHILVSTHPPGRSTWLERRVVDLARQRFAIPVSHVVVDLERERAARPGQPVSDRSR